MSILILSAETGRGHVSVMRALAEQFEESGYTDCICIPDFYESMLPSNKILSDFYNYLLASSTSLCEKYVQFTTLTRPDMNEVIYRLTRKHYVEILSSHPIEAVISTATAINYGLIRTLAEEGLADKIPFYIVVTDPYDPIAPGFDVPGATKYFCANDTVRRVLADSGIDERRVAVSGYPVSGRFCQEGEEVNRPEVYAKLGLNPDRQVVLLNSGSKGDISTINLLNQFLSSDIDANLIMLCGTNKSLFRLARLHAKRSSRTNLQILPFYESMDELLSISDVYITKAGANSFYEALSSGVPLLINATEGYLYQERGIAGLLHDIEADRLLVEHIEDFTGALKELLTDEGRLYFKKHLQRLDVHNGAPTIVNTILADLQSR
ncbi:hypothetical protein KIH86_13525 [Paenibacillus sp. HN-1]|uniref:MGDG synthase family glycosyltransferase n=1 Tax=Paenibacillus TaxID=44249 RepID=UPI001CA8C309|nr:MULTISPECIES: glycosyltransferase [Paenibacillus]MBY9080760.1 hypothetical protein [Paenibacillus sp. CGMCC 1.18879]MBY9085248.1 hypothetical protein [Paenibacillus sinensis]